MRGRLPLAFATPERCARRAGLPPDDLRDTLGLDTFEPGPEVFRGVSRGDVATLRYRAPDGDAPRAPTVADSGFDDGAFAVTSARRGLGWTRHLADDRPGMPEVVHRPFPASALARKDIDTRFGRLQRPAPEGWRVARAARYEKQGHVRT